VQRPAHLYKAFASEVPQYKTQQEKSSTTEHLPSPTAPSSGQPKIASLCHSLARRWNLHHPWRTVSWARAVLGEGCSGVPGLERVKGRFSFLEPVEQTRFFSGSIELALVSYLSSRAGAIARPVLRRQNRDHRSAVFSGMDLQPPAQLPNSLLHSLNSDTAFQRSGSTLLLN